MPVDQWKKEADRIKYGHAAPRKNKWGSRKSKRNAAKRDAVHSTRLQCLNTKLWFGKYKDMTIGQVRDLDPGYLRWLLTTKPPKGAWRMQKLQQFLRTLT